MENTRLRTINQVVQLKWLSRYRLDQLRRQGQLPGMQIGSTFLVDTARLHEMLFGHPNTENTD